MAAERYALVRQPTPLFAPPPSSSAHLSGTPYAVDVRGKLMVVATADRKIVVVNLDQPSVAFNTITSPLKYHSPAAPPPSARSSSEPLRMIQRYQSRCIAAFPDQRGFCLGSIEGRVAVHHVNPTDSAKNVCHERLEPKSGDLRNLS